MTHAIGTGWAWNTAMRLKPNGTYEMVAYPNPETVRTANMNDVNSQSGGPSPRPKPAAQPEPAKRRQTSDEVRAMAKIEAILADLDPEAAERVATWVMSAAKHRNLKSYPWAMVPYMQAQAQSQLSQRPDRITNDPNQSNG